MVSPLARFAVGRTVSPISFNLLLQDCLLWLNTIWLIVSVTPVLLLFSTFCKNTGGGFTGLNNGGPPQQVCAPGQVFIMPLTHTAVVSTAVAEEPVNLPTSRDSTADDPTVAAAGCCCCCVW